MASCPSPLAFRTLIFWIENRQRELFHVFPIVQCLNEGLEHWFSNLSEQNHLGVLVKAQMAGPHPIQVFH